MPLELVPLANEVYNLNCVSPGDRKRFPGTLRTDMINSLHQLSSYF